MTSIHTGLQRKRDHSQNKLAGLWVIAFWGGAFRPQQAAVAETGPHRRDRAVVDRDRNWR